MKWRYVASLDLLKKSSATEGLARPNTLHVFRWLHVLQDINLEKMRITSLNMTSLISPEEFTPFTL